MKNSRYYDYSKWELKNAKKNGGNTEEQHSKLGQLDLIRDQEMLKMSKTAYEPTQSLTMSDEQLRDLRRVQNERVEAEKLKQMGFNPKEGLGVRYERNYR
ncbi:hypothetical protein AYI69_g10665 [Smittium culicis]|uniref:Uncharacterized protein n=1 Tax=Smittium culicis TaxID=133412 RepID=A0A1R1X493_9FUNG|nr:hypothetical protein AYI69_g10665 [Smittium culicis]